MKWWVLWLPVGAVMAGLAARSFALGHVTAGSFHLAIAVIDLGLFAAHLHSEPPP